MPDGPNCYIVYLEDKAKRRKQIRNVGCHWDDQVAHNTTLFLVRLLFEGYLAVPVTDQLQTKEVPVLPTAWLYPTPATSGEWLKYCSIQCWAATLSWFVRSTQASSRCIHDKRCFDHGGGSSSIPQLATTVSLHIIPRQIPLQTQMLNRQYCCFSTFFCPELLQFRAKLADPLHLSIYFLYIYLLLFFLFALGEWQMDFLVLGQRSLTVKKNTSLVQAMYITVR